MARSTPTADDAPAGADDAANRLALVKLMRGSGFAVIDVGRGREAHVATVGEGRHPHGLALHPGGRWAYLAFAGSSTVETVDLETLSVVARTGAVGTAPIGVEPSRDGRYLFVTAYGDLPDDGPGLTVLRTGESGDTVGGGIDRDPTPVAHLPIGTCAGVVVDEAGDVWVALKDDDEVVRLAGEPPFDVRDRIAVPGDPQDLAYAPHYGLIGVNNVDDGSVSFVDVHDRELAGTVDAPNPRGGAVSVVHDRWFVGDTEGDGVSVVDVGGDAPSPDERLRLGTPTAFADVSPDGRYAVVDAYDDDRVTFVDVATLDVHARVRVGDTPRHPRFGADGRRCYVPTVDDDALAVVDTASLSGSGSDTGDPGGDPNPTLRTRIDLPTDTAPSSCFLTGRGRGDADR